MSFPISHYGSSSSSGEFSRFLTYHQFTQCYHPKTSLSIVQTGKNLRFAKCVNCLPDPKGDVSIAVVYCRAHTSLRTKYVHWSCTSVTGLNIDCYGYSDPRQPPGYSLSILHLWRLFLFYLGRGTLSQFLLSNQRTSGARVRFTNSLFLREIFTCFPQERPLFLFQFRCWSPSALTPPHASFL